MDDEENNLDLRTTYDLQLDLKIILMASLVISQETSDERYVEAYCAPKQMISEVCRRAIDQIISLLLSTVGADRQSAARPPTVYRAHAK